MVRDILRLIWFSLGSNHSSGKALFVVSWKLLEIYDRGEARADCSPEQSTGIIQIQWSAAHTDMYACKLGYKLCPNIECNKYVNKCVFGGQSDPNSEFFCCKQIACSVSSSYYVSLSVYQVWGSAGFRAASLLIFDPLHGLLNLTPECPHTHTYILIPLLFSALKHSNEFWIQQEACGGHVIWPACRP